MSDEIWQEIYALDARVNGKSGIPGWSCLFLANEFGYAGDGIKFVDADFKR